MFDNFCGQLIFTVYTKLLIILYFINTVDIVAASEGFMFAAVMESQNY